MAPATSAASSTAILNSDASDRKIESFVADCSGVGTSLAYLTGTGLTSTGWNVNMATSSTGAQLTNASALTMFIPTTTPDAFNSIGAGTTTPSAAQRVWAAGSYLVFTFNATNTASCVIGVHYLAS